MMALLALFVFVAFWFGIARQLKKNGRGWLGRNIIAGVGASFAFLLVVMVDIAMSDPIGQLADKQAAAEAKISQAKPKAKTEAGVAPQFASVSEMVEDFGDFPEDTNEFAVITKQPLHVRFSPIVTQADPQDVIDEQTKRALIYGIYRPFIHTDIDEITVTAQPLEVTKLFNRGADEGKLLSKPKFTVTKTRAEALQDVQSFLSIDDMTEIVNSDGAFSTFTKDFNQLYYNDQGGAGLDAFILKITKR